MSDDYFGFNTTQKRSLQRLLDETIIGTGSVGTTELANASVTTAKLGADAVTGAKIADDAVDTEHIAAGAITDAEVDAAAAIAATKIDVAAGTDGLANDDLQAILQTLRTYVVNLNTWAVALATKLNADAGVTDVNYDTNPQA